MYVLNNFKINNVDSFKYVAAEIWIFVVPIFAILYLTKRMHTLVPGPKTQFLSCRKTRVSFFLKGVEYSYLIYHKKIITRLNEHYYWYFCRKMPKYYQPSSRHKEICFKTIYRKIQIHFIAQYNYSDIFSSKKKYLRIKFVGFYYVPTGTYRMVITSVTLNT